MADDDTEKRPSGYQTPMWNFGSSITKLTDPQELLWQLELYLRNAREDAQGKVVHLGEPRMNEAGINDVLGMISSLVNQPAILSNFEKYEVEALMGLLSDTLCKTLMVNCNKYGIRSKVDRYMINQAVISIAFVTLKRAFGEGERKFWKGSVQEIKSVHEMQTKGGFNLKKLNPFG